ncbi:hypothetical protein CRUP_000877 [Coryphaenoides rupestris]|nr:hypothetical protein CRUP_000877 [Coryphaenoides rupestris]
MRCCCSADLLRGVGNVLVCVAVWGERTLQTTTNYLIVSLAVSDLLLATLVMPWGVVGEWGFSLLHCDLLLTLDVMMCTASILNLCAISIDSRDGKKCSFADPSFVVYSSVASFYVPFIVTLLVYAQICVVLRRRGRRTAPPRRPTPSQKTCPLASQAPQALQAQQAPSTQQGFSEPGDAQRLRKNKCTHPEDVKLCTLMLGPPSAAPQRKRVVSLRDKDLIHLEALLHLEALHIY